jgi:meso-butanediol dehydrogenase/(S,S)-butanediol dehydrogenase/diacetyl reductase
MTMGILDRFSLSGKTALVTGAGRGLGQGMALALAEAGADIAIAELDLPAAEETAAMVRERGRRALPFKSDVTDFEAVQAMFKSVVEEWKRLDILHRQQRRLRPADLGPGDNVQDWERMLAET